MERHTCADRLGDLSESAAGDARSATSGSKEEVQPDAQVEFDGK